jgi:hypothetical protein
MHDHSTEHDPADEDAKFQRLVLELLLEAHPAQLTEAELIREATDNPEGFTQRDGIARAIRDLAGVGVLHRNGDFVLPTRAALHINGLWGVIA